MVTKRKTGFVDAKGVEYLLSGGDRLVIRRSTTYGILISVTGRHGGILYWDGGEDDKLLVELAPTSQTMNVIALTVVAIFRSFTGLRFDRDHETSTAEALIYTVVDPDVPDASN